MAALKIIDDIVLSRKNDDESLIVYWGDLDRDQIFNERVIYLPDLVEERADSLRTRFLSLICGFGNHEIKGIRLEEYLEIRDKFSFWWMSRVFEKCNWDKSPHIHDVIKLMALEEWARGINYDEIIVHSCNINLIKTLRLWAKEKKILFKSISKSKNIRATTIKFFFRRLFNYLSGPLWLLHYFFSRISLKGIGRNTVISSGASITFISYLFNVPDQVRDNNKLGSQFWGPLLNFLSQEKIKTNWIHLYVKDKKTPTAKKAAKVIDGENMTSVGLTSHATLDSFLGSKFFIKVLKDWVGLIKKSREIVKFRFNDENSLLDFTAFFEFEWRDSIFGKSCMANLISFNLLEELMTNLTYQKLGFYLQENCPWELALNFLWRRAGHGKLIGVPHATIFFWDLRYFYDPRCLSLGEKLEIPMPDFIAVNGSAASKIMKEGGYIKNKVIEVEALRYLYLNDTQSNLPRTVSNQIKMLVLCDYTIARTLNQLDVLFEAIKRLNFGIEVIIKPHPNCPIDTKKDIPKCCQIKYDPVSELLKTCNVAYTTDATSASVEAYIKGLPIISVLNPSGFNLSPLRNFSDVVFIRNGLELSQALSSLYDIGIVKQESSRDNYFNLDNNLPKWKSIFNLGGVK